MFLRDPSIKVYAFEPVPTAFKELQELSTFFPNLIPIQVALGAKEEKATMYVNEKNTELSTLSKEVSEFGQAKKLGLNAFQVDIVTLDLYLNDFEEQIDLLKIDVEGFEMEVLSGAKKTLVKNTPRYIQIENSRHNLLRGNTIFDFSNKLPNYDLFQISNSSKSGLRKLNATDFDANIFLYSNFVFVRKLP